MLSPKTVSESRVQMSQMMLPTDANPVGYVHGGTVMKMVDVTAAVAAIRHARCRTTTARIDSMSFLAPIRVGDMVTVYASVNDVGRTSMEVGARVESEDLRTGIVSHVASAYLVFVALDEHGHPRPVPPLIAESDIERARMAEAKVRRDYRMREAEMIRAYRRPAGFANLHSICPPTGKTQIIGHRGAMGHAPENTMASFAKGVELGADIIELDIHLSKDEELIVMHDHRVDRTTDGKGFIMDMTLRELKSLDAGSWFGQNFTGQQVPTLDEVLAWAKGRTKVAIEVKNGPVYYTGIEERTLEVVRKAGMVDSVAVISFDHHCVKKIKQLEPTLTTGVLYAARPVDAVSLATAADADILMPNWAYVGPDLIEAAHRANVAVCTWVVNETSELECVLGLNVDGIGTNFPDRMYALLNQGDS